MSGAYKHPLRLVSPHIHGQRVKDAQWLLAGHGKVLKKKCYHGAVDGDYGPQTAGATKHAKYWLGYPKRKCDTAFGQTFYDYLVGRKKLSAIMRWRIKHRKALAKKRAQRSLYKKLLAEETKFIGVHESPAGSNLQMFGAWYGMNGVPWCAIFQSYGLCHVGRNFRYSYVPAIVSDARMARNRMRVIPYSAVQECINHGHVVLACFDWNHDGTADHVGMVVHVDGAEFHTIEGNTSDSNFSNGGTVARAIRYPAQVQVFVEVF